MKLNYIKLEEGKISFLDGDYLRLLTIQGLTKNYLNKLFIYDGENWEFYLNMPGFKKLNENN